MAYPLDDYTLQRMAQQQMKEYLREIEIDNLIDEVSQQVAMPALPAASLVGRRLVGGRASLDLLGLTFYGWGARTGAPTSGWQRVLGAEQELDTDPIPLLHAPGIHAVLGVGYTLDERPRRTWRLYGMTRFRP